MFKVESYITPIILSYVDKYIKNFRPEDSQVTMHANDILALSPKCYLIFQVSLWGGDATFHNLDLRLEVLEQELQLPFSFVSGHIHELLIHVPWTKLPSEPITITINTIGKCLPKDSSYPLSLVISFPLECILKLRSSDSSPVSDMASQQKERLKRQTSRK